MSSRVAVKAALLALAFMLVILGISAYSLSVDRNSELTDSLAFGCAVASELLESAEDDAQRVAILETLRKTPGWALPILTLAALLYMIIAPAEST